MRLKELKEAVRYPTIEAVEQYLTHDYTIIDRDMGGVFIIEDPESRQTFDVRVGPPLEVHPHEDTDENQRLAQEIYLDLIRHAEQYYNA